jgi:hypothetical protein
MAARPPRLSRHFPAPILVPDRGIVLFESPEALIQKAERLIEDKYSPLIIIDDTEETAEFRSFTIPLLVSFCP